MEYWSGITELHPTTGIVKNIKDAIDNLLGETGAAERAINEGVLDLNYQSDQEPLRELSTPGFFSMCYPSIFVNGTCDITIKKIHTIELKEWIQHLYYVLDNRVASHPFLKFHLHNILMKQRALSQGRFVVTQRLHENHLTVDQLRERVEQGDDSVSRQFIKVASNLPNTDPYWHKRQKEIEALMYYMLLEKSTLPTYFDTNSCAEFRWDKLGQLLCKYHSVIKKK